MSTKVPARIRKLMKEFKEGLVRIYGDRLKAVYLYGSYARGDYREGSDVDVMILSEKLQKLSGMNSENAKGRKTSILLSFIFLLSPQV